MMNDLTDSQAQQINLQQTTRRHFFSQCSMGLGSVALGSVSYTHLTLPTKA